MLSNDGVGHHAVRALEHALSLNIPRTTLLYGIEIGTEIPYGEDLTPKLKGRFKTAVRQIVVDMRNAAGRGSTPMNDAHPYERVCDADRELFP